MAHFVFLLLLAVAAVMVILYEMLSPAKAGETISRVSVFALVSALALIVISLIGIAETAAVL